MTVLFANSIIVPRSYFSDTGKKKMIFSDLRRFLKEQRLPRNYQKRYKRRGKFSRIKFYRKLRTFKIFMPYVPIRLVNTFRSPQFIQRKRAKQKLLRNNNQYFLRAAWRAKINKITDVITSRSSYGSKTKLSELFSIYPIAQKSNKPQKYRNLRF